MGCGSSSLKGDGATGVDNDPAPRPLQKIATNFSTVNYDNTTQNRRTTEYAPHETEAQPTTIDEAVEHAKAGVDTTTTTTTDSKAATAEDGGKLAPYKTIEGDEPMDPSEAPTPATAAAPVTNGVKDASDPTSDFAKDEFAKVNDPANPHPHPHQLNGAGTASGISPSNTNTNTNTSPGGTEGKKDSWLGKKYKSYADARDGRGSSISDEDLKKYTGKSREEVDELREKGDGVGYRQPVDFTKGFAGAGTVAGIGG